MKKIFGHALRFPNVTFKLVVALYMLYYIFGYKQMTFGHALRFPNVAWLPPPHQVNTPLYHIVEDQYTWSTVKIKSIHYYVEDHLTSFQKGTTF